MCRTPDPQPSDHTTEPWCANCFTYMLRCLVCQEFRCQPEIHLSMVGSTPLACRRCRPDGIDQVYEFDPHAPGAGPYRAGARLIVDGKEAFKLT